MPRSSAAVGSFTVLLFGADVMTTCELIMKPIVRMVEEEGKNLDEIAGSVCPTIEYGREKIIRVIKDFLGEDYLIQHAETLGYNVKMAELAKKRVSHKNIDAKDDSDVSKKPSLKKAIKNLLKYYSPDEIHDVLEELELEVIQ